MNLDALCAQYGYEIVQQAVQSKKDTQGRISKSDQSKLENTITKSLGVLQENGIYAFFLFLDYFKDRGESLGAQDIASKLTEWLREVQVLGSRQNNERDDFPAVRRLTDDLDLLLLARQLVERGLVYARYHAKALEVPQAQGVARS